MNNTSDNGQQNFWIDGDTYESYNVGLPVKEETFWLNGESFSLLMSDPTSGLFLEFF
jgi:hypothetical protein